MGLSKEKSGEIPLENLKVNFSPCSEEIMNTAQPETISINGVEIPSYKTCWSHFTSMEEDIVRLKSRCRLQMYLLAIQGLAIILAVAMRLC